MRKKWMAAVLAAAMVLGHIPAVELGAVTTYSTDFNEDTAGRQITDTTEGSAASTWRVSNFLKGSGDAYLKYGRINAREEDSSDLYPSLIIDQTEENTTGNVSFWRNFNNSGYGSNLTIQFDLRMFDYYAGRTVQFRNGATVGTAAYPLLKTSGGQMTFFGDSASAWSFDTDWHTYRFDLIFDMPEDGVQTVRAYVDGELKYSGNRTDIISVNYFDFFQITATSGKGYAAEMGLDNFSISDIPDLVDFTDLDAAIEDAEDMYEDMGDEAGTADREVFQEAIDAAKAVRGNPSVTVEDVKGAVVTLNYAMEVFRRTCLDDREDFDELRERIVLDLGKVALGYENDLSDSVIKAAVEAAEENVEEILAQLVTGSDRTRIFEDYAPTSANGVYITSTVRYLKTLALAYNQPGNEYYHDDDLKEIILEAYDFILTNWYNETKTEAGNWWDWEIGVPKHSLDIFMIMFDEISPEDQIRYGVAYRHFLDMSKYETTQTGANRLDLAAIAARIGVLTYDSSLIERATSAIYEELQYNSTVPSGTNGAGFYPDGTFIQHNNVAYNGSYGKDLLVQLIKYMADYSGTEWEIDESYQDFIYDVVHTAYAPLIYNGKMMDMVNGRAIVRKNSNITIGYEIMNAMYQLSMVSDSEDREALQGLLKEWISGDGFLYADPAEENIGSTAISANLRMFMKESDAEPEGEMIYHKSYPLMDRVVHTGTDYAFGLSMFSSRILSYEQTNGENLKGWYTGSGMTYVYNGDPNQYTDGYWYTVNMYRLPGTTVTTEPRVTDRWNGEYLSEHDWVGSSSLMDQYGSAGMMMSQWDMRLKNAGNAKNESDTGWTSALNGKKSWFMFDDEIVALGAGISNTSGYSVETVVENRMIDSAGTWSITFNGDEPLISLSSAARKIEDVSYAHIDGGQDSYSVGYYFPEGVALNALKERRTENRSHVDSSHTGGEVYTGSYATMWIDHGVDPDAAEYAYVILPSVSGEGVETYAENPDIEILANNELVQAAKDSSIGVMGANFWTDGEATADIVTSYNMASVTLKQEGDRLTIAVSDPALEQNQIKLDIGKTGVAVIVCDSRISVDMTGEDIELTVNTANGKGASFEVVLRVEPDRSAAPEFASAVSDAGIEVGTTSVTVADELTGSLKYQISDSAIATPFGGDVVDGLTEYVNGGDIAGVDAETNKYLAIYEVDAEGKIIKFQLFIVTAERLRAEPLVHYTLAVLAGAGGTVVGSGGSYAAGEVVPVSAAADSYYRFAGWTSGNGGVFADNARANTTFTMPEGDVTITASFEAITDPAAYHTLTIKAGTGGTVAGSGGSYAAGEEVSISATPSNNYRFSGWMTNNGGAFVNATSAGTVFIMPDKDVTITAAFAYIGVDADDADDDGDSDSGSGGGSGTETATSTTGAAGATVGTAVELAESGAPLGVPEGVGVLDRENRIAYINGYAGSVRPDDPITRAETVAIFFKLLTDAEKDSPLKSPFGDVEDGMWYSQAAAYLASIGVVSGYPDGSFQPNKPITRAEFLTIAMHFEDMSETEDETIFSDMDASHWASGYVNAAYHKNWISGYPDGAFRPDQPITRAEAVAIVNAMLNRTAAESAGEGLENPYNDIDGSHWAYWEIIAASAGGE